jgi:predicted RNA-binding protein YlqC (UPF0109 family)
MALPVDQEFIEYLAKALVNHPEAVKTERTLDEMGVLITLKVHPEDMGYIIGKQGQTAKALRTLLKIVGAKAKARLNLKIEEPEGGRVRSAPLQTPLKEAVEDLKL